MRKIPLLLASALLALELSPAPAAACSVVSGYRPPSNFELVEGADTILLATVEGGDDRIGDSDQQGVIVRPTLLLKGEALPETLRIGGIVRTEPRIVMTRSDPRELYAPNPDALSGACQRFIFERGMILLLFLDRDPKGGLRIGGGPFSRAAEDVPSADALWVRATRLYLEIAALPSAERRPAMIARRDALRAAGGDPDSALLAADIDRQLERL